MPVFNMTDPHRPVSKFDHLISLQLWSSLIRMDENGRTASDFASRWEESLDHLSWKFEIKPDLRFSDGSHLRPEDILRSLESSIRNSAVTNLKDALDRAELIPPRTLKIVLRHPAPNFLNTLSEVDQSILAPENHSGAIALTAQTRCTGPYRIENASSSEVVLVPNRYYPFHEKLSPLRVTLSGGIAAKTIAKGLLDGSFNFGQLRSDLLDEKELTALRERDFQEWSTPNRDWISDFVVGVKGLTRISAHDRRVLLKLLSISAASAPRSDLALAIGISPPFMPGSLSESDWRKLVESCPDRVSQPLTLDVYVMDKFHDSFSYERAISALRAAGIQIQETVYRSPVDPETRKKLHAGEFDLMFAYESVNDPDPDRMWRELQANVPYPRPVLPEKILRAAASAKTPDARSALYRQLEIRNFEDPFRFPLRRVSDLFFLGRDLSISGHAPFVLFPRFEEIH